MGMLTPQLNLRFPALAVMMVACCLLPGCAGPQLQASASLASLRPEATTLSVVSVYGVSSEAGQRFQDVLMREAKARGFAIAGADTGASTKLKAHLSSYPGDGGKLAFSWVLQTSEDGRNPAARVSGAMLSNAPAASGWGAFDETVMRQVAARGVDDLARVLTAGSVATNSSEESPTVE